MSNLTKKFRSSAHLASRAAAIVVTCVCLFLIVPALAGAAVLHPYQSQITEAAGAPFKFPCGLSVEPTTGNLYVADAGNPVDIFDPAGNYKSQIFGPGPGGSFIGPEYETYHRNVGEIADSCSIAAGADGTLYIAEGQSEYGLPKWIESYNTSSYHLASNAGAATPSGHLLDYGSLAIDPTSGDIYFACQSEYNNEAVIYKFSPSGDLLSELRSPQFRPGNGQTPIVVDGSGNVYVWNSAGGPIVKFNHEGEQVAFVNGSQTPAGSFLSQPSEAGLAVDASDDLYVVDGAAGAVDEFSPTGTYLGRITGVETPGGSDNPLGVAVSASGKVYVSDPSAKAVDVFGPAVRALTALTTKASGRTTTSAVLNGTVDPESEEVQACVFEWGEGTSGSYEHTVPCESPSAAELGSGSANEPVHADVAGLSIATAYHYRLVATGANGVEEGANGSFETLPAVSIAALAPTAITSTAVTVHAGLDPNGNGNITACEVQYVTEAAFIAGGYSDLSSGGSASCSPALPYSGSQAISAQLTGLAGESGPVTYHYRVIATDSGGSTIGADRSFTTTGPPRFGITSVAAVSVTEATLNAQLAPEGLATSYRFEYLTQAQFEDGAFANPAVSRTAEAPLGLTVEQAIAVSAEGGDYRLSFNGESTGDIAFDAPASALQEALRALPAIGPNGASVTGGPGDQHGSHPYRIAFEGPLAEVEVPELVVEEGSPLLQGNANVSIAAAGPDHSKHPVSAQLSGLAPGTNYKYRLVATNSQSPAGGAIGPEGTFRTYSNPGTGAGCPNEAFRTGFSASLPDCRAYELVSAGDTGDSEVYVPHVLEGGDLAQGFSTGRPFQVAPLGNSIAYIGDPSPAGGSGEGGNGVGVQYVATRAPGGGWRPVNIQPPRLSVQYQGFSSALSLGVVSSGYPNQGEAPLSPDAPGGGYPVLYSRSPGETLAPGQSPFNPLYPEPISFTRGAGEFGSTYAGRPPAFAGASADATNLFFEVDDALLPAEAALASELSAAVQHEIAHREFHNYLYDSVAGKLSLIDVSPQGKVLPNATVGAQPPEGNRVSSSGNLERNLSNAISTDGRRVYWTDLANGHLYLRLNPAQPQSEIEEGACSEAAKACTLAVSSGSASFWTASANGRYAFYTEAGRLYRYDAQTEEAEALTPAGAQVQGVLGASEAGGAVYFAADAALTVGPNAAGLEPDAGQPNLYRWSGGATTFVATLAEADGEAEEPMTLAERGANPPVSDGYGDWYPSLASRTARVTGDGESLVFMSLRSLPVVGRPQGYPSEGKAEVYLYQAASDQLFCASCAPTGTAPTGSSYLPPSNSETYLPQWLSEDGNRVFFDSPDALAANDTDNAQDVYQWERQGSGSCTAAEAVDGGCTALLSVANPNDSWLIGASADGSDAFFVSRAQLSPEDGNEKMDLYDARVGAEPAHAEVICEGREECQRSETPPPPYTSSPTASFHSPGNPTEKQCKKGLVRKHGKCVKQKAKKHHKQKGKKQHKRTDSNRGGTK